MKVGIDTKEGTIFIDIEAEGGIKTSTNMDAIAARFFGEQLIRCADDIDNFNETVSKAERLNND